MWCRVLGDVKTFLMSICKLMQLNGAFMWGPWQQRHMAVTWLLGCLVIPLAWFVVIMSVIRSWKLISKLKESESEVAQLCPALCDPMDCSPPGILKARILESVPISFSRGSSQPRDRTQVSCIADRCFILWATREALVEMWENHKYEESWILSPTWSDLWTQER